MRCYLLTVAALSLTVSQANALDFSTQLLDSDGKPLCMDNIRESDPCPTDRILTLNRASRLALATLAADEANLSGDEKFKRGELARRLTEVNEPKLRVEEIAIIKKAIGKLFNPPVVFAAWRLLDPEK